MLLLGMDGLAASWDQVTAPDTPSQGCGDQSHVQSTIPGAKRKLGDKPRSGRATVTGSRRSRDRYTGSVTQDS